MNLKEEVQLPLDRDTIFNALNDPEILKQSIPGCEELTPNGENELLAKVVVKFGPVKANFDSNVEVDPSQGPELFTLSGTGDAGVAGYVQGGANVRLDENDEGTRLTYEVNIDISGKLAQVGGRLIESTSKRLAKKFFTNFEQVLTQDQAST